MTLLLTLTSLLQWFFSGCRWQTETFGETSDGQEFQIWRGEFASGYADRILCEFGTPDAYFCLKQGLDDYGPDRVLVRAGSECATSYRFRGWSYPEIILWLPKSREGLDWWRIQ